MQTAIPSVLMRGGTSKGLFFLRDDLPNDAALRNRVLLSVMGSPDMRQIDGVGGAHPLTSKVAVVARAADAETDVDYLFLQVMPDRADVSDRQNCGNMLAGVGPFAIESGLVEAGALESAVRIRMLNTGGIAVASVRTPGHSVQYDGDAIIDGVPATAAPVMLNFEDVAGSSCGSLLPTGNPVDEIDGVGVTCIDNGMPVVVLNAADLQKTGNESPQELESDATLRTKIESIRLQSGPLMNLGDVEQKTIPKMTLVAPARNGGAIATRTFIPHRVHEAIGVLGATSVAAACLIDGTVAQAISGLRPSTGPQLMDIEHPGGMFSVEMDIEKLAGEIIVRRSAVLRTARKLMQGFVFIPAALWQGP